MGQQFASLDKMFIPYNNMANDKPELREYPIILDLYSKNRHFDGYWGYAHNSLGTMWKLDTSIQFEGECLSCRNDGYPHCNEFPGGILPIKEIWNQIFEVPIPDMLEFIPGCQFHIHKNLIYNKSLILWEKLYNMSENMQYFPWMFERIVPYILNNNFKIKQ